MVKWQTIISYGGGGISVIFLIILITNLSGISYSVSKDIFCTECYSEIKINSTYWEIKVEHAGNKDVVFKKLSRSRTLYINLDKLDEFLTTEPRIKTEILVPATKETAKIKHEEYGYLRNLRDGDVLISRGSDRFVIHGSKPVNLTVKWSFNIDDSLIKAVNIDPTWFGISITYEQVCHNEYFKRIERTYGKCIFKTQTTVCSDFPINLSCSIKEVNITQPNAECLISTIEYIDTINICRNVGVELENQFGRIKFNWEKEGWNCKLNNFIFECVHQRDGDIYKGKTSGQNYILFDIRNFKMESNIDVSSIKEFEVEKI